MSKNSNREYLIVATLTNAKKKEVWQRHYLTPDSAISRAMFELSTKGAPLDTITFTHKVTSKYLGYVRIHAGGKFTGERVWDQPEHVDAEAVRAAEAALNAELKKNQPTPYKETAGEVVS
jgi:hypothetical protein